VPSNQPCNIGKEPCSVRQECVPQLRNRWRRASAYNNRRASSSIAKAHLVCAVAANVLYDEKIGLIPVEDAPVSVPAKSHVRIACFMLLVLILSAMASLAVNAEQQAMTRIASSRRIPLNVKIVFIGFNRSNVDTEYLAWKENLPSERINKILVGEQETGVTYDLQYEFVFPDNGHKQRLLDFLRQIGNRTQLENPWFETETNNVFYDANKVENWFYKNRADYGGVPSNGYTFIIGNLTDLPSITYEQMSQPWKNASFSPHYYSVEYVDEDLGYKLRNRQFMTAWGGHYRMYFFDISAGPSFNTPEDPPLQVVLKARKMNLSTEYGKVWLTQYLADYLWEIIWNLAVPQFVYEPIYSSRYHFFVNIFDNRTDLEKKAVPLEKTVNRTRIELAFRELLPYSEIQVTMRMQNTTSDPDLSRMIKNSFQMIDRVNGYVDVRPLYRYLQQNLSSYVPRILRNEEEYTIPVFCFAFSKQHVGYTSKWQIQGFAKSLLGIALNDMVMISLTQYNEFERGAMVKPPQGTKGIGFTQTIIHESGHMIGLMHPFQFGQITDFVDSPMSYFSHSSNFTQFDKDSLWRAHADRVLLESATRLAEADELARRRLSMPTSQFRLFLIHDLIGKAEIEYEKMNYAESVRLALAAKSAASEGLKEMRNMPSIWPIAAIYGIVIGVIIGFHLALDRRKLELVVSRVLSVARHRQCLTRAMSSSVDRSEPWPTIA